MELVNYSAIVIGSTGAVGREVVAQLVNSKKCTKVVAITRKSINDDDYKTVFPSLDLQAAKNKLLIRPVDFESLKQEDVQIISNAESSHVDAIFCCLGTTRKDAGSAEAFRRVDLGYVKRSAELAKAVNTPYFGLLTASNANASSWFLYPQTKGLAEAAVKDLSFSRTSIFRPGMIDRGSLARTVERWAAFVVPSITATAIAKGMVHDFENGTTALKEWSNSDLKEFENK